MTKGQTKVVLWIGFLLFLALVTTILIWLDVDPGILENREYHRPTPTISVYNVSVYNDTNREVSLELNSSLSNFNLEIPGGGESLFKIPEGSYNFELHFKHSMQCTSTGELSLKENLNIDLTSQDNLCLLFIEK